MSISLALALAFVPGSVILAASGEVAQTAATEVAPPLTTPVREVLKLVSADVPETVIKAYIVSSRSTFNLTSETIIYLKEQGVPSEVTDAILVHDRALADSRSAAPPQNPQPSYDVEQSAVAPLRNSDPVNDYDLYNNLAPYGSWASEADYGWVWQPYPKLAVDFYPWGWLGFGAWSFFPARGWCWVPHSHFRHFDRFHFHENRGLIAGNRFGGNRFSGNHFDHFSGRGFVGGQVQSRAFNHGPGFHAPGVNGSVGLRSVPAIPRTGAAGGGFHGSAGLRSSPVSPRMGASGGFHGSAGGFSGAHGGFSGGGHGSGSGGGHGGGGHGGHR
jgi:hypothetical protein